MSRNLDFSFSSIHGFSQRLARLNHEHTLNRQVSPELPQIHLL